MTPLHDIRVLDLTDESGAFAGRILADLGADVVMIEPPEGVGMRRRLPGLGDDLPVAERSFAHQYFNANKRSVVIGDDPTTLRGWAESADVVLATPPFRLPYASALAANSNVVYASITPFGLETEWHGRKANDLVALAAGGLIFLSGEPKGVPVQGGANPSHTIAGLVASTGVMLALHNGGGALLDISVQEAVAALTLQTAAPSLWRWFGKVPGRPGLSNAARCADGRYVGLMIRPDRFDLFLRWLGEVGVDHALTLDDWPLARADASPVGNPVSAAMVKLAKALPRDEFVAGAMRADLVCLPTLNFPDMEHHEQYVVNHQFFAVRHEGLKRDLGFVRSPVDVYDGPIAIVPAPFLGERSAEPPSDRPHSKPKRSADPYRALEGVRVVDFGWVLAAPIGTRILASFGAEVIRIESSTKPDSIRASPGPDGRPDAVLGALFNDANAGKKSLAVDLTDARGRALVHQLIGVSDVVVNNFRPGALERMGFGFEAIRRDRQDIVLLNMPGPHRFGPWAPRPSMGNIMMGASGFNELTGFEGERPRGIGIAYPDFTSPYLLVTTILGALRERERYGRGHEIHLTQLSGMVSLLGAEWMQYKATGMQPRRKANRDENFCPHGVYPSIGDNEWVAIAVEGDDEWAAFARLVGTDPHDDRYATHAARKANEDSLDTLVRSWTMGRDRWTIADDCQAVGIAAAAVATLPDMMDRDPQLRHRYQTVQQPGHLDVDIPVSREAIRFAGAEQTVERAPIIGEHTEYVVRDLLGLSDEEYVALLLGGVLS